MFDSTPAGVRAVLTLEPWAPDYGAAIDLSDEEDPEDGSSFEIDPFIETQDWSQGVTPAPLEFPQQVAFIDGVQRIESWARLDDGESMGDAALASVAAGATISEAGHSRIECGLPSRVLAVAGLVETQPLVVSHGGQSLVFEVQRAQQTGRHAVGQAIAVRRRDLEQWWIQKLLPDYPLVIADGRLDRPVPGTNLLAGVAKTLHQLYLSGPQRALVSRLTAGTRTPVFLIRDSWGARFSWFLRLPHTRPIHHSYAGIVRLETPDIGRREAIEAADMLSHNLPRFASRPEHDPRAPQNLLPVGALEKRLRHEMGDPRFIRRLIEDHLAKELAHV
jgi:hypothetical protein